MDRGRRRERSFINSSTLGCSPDRKDMARNRRQIQSEIGPGLGWYGHRRGGGRGEEASHTSRRIFRPVALHKSDKKVAFMWSLEQLNFLSWLRLTLGRVQTTSMMHRSFCPRSLGQKQRSSGISMEP